MALRPDQFIDHTSSSASVRIELIAVAGSFPMVREHRPLSYRLPALRASAPPWWTHPRESQPCGCDSRRARSSRRRRTEPRGSQTMGSCRGPRNCD